jgi:hypothetical protein
VRDQAQPEREPSRAVSSIVSSAATRSSSEIALAIQVTSWYETSPRRAVTKPPPPRLATRSPFWRE